MFYLLNMGMFSKSVMGSSLHCIRLCGDLDLIFCEWNDKGTTKKFHKLTLGPILVLKVSDSALILC